MTISSEFKEKRLFNERPNRSKDNKYQGIKKDDDRLDILDIADGLKELLRKNKLTLEILISLSPSELSDILGIDGYISKIICESAKKRASSDSNGLVYVQDRGKILN